jgi:outer membrane lipoprotein carrier protein
MDRVKCWFRRRRRTTEAFVLTASLAAGIISTQVVAQIRQTAHFESAQETADSSDQSLPAELRHFLEQVASFRAGFIQELWSDDQRLMEVAQGTVELQRPGRFRWHYDEPYEQLIVADGENLWMYDVDISQVTRSTLPADDSGNPGALLSGDADIVQSFAVVGSTIDGETVSIDLVPRAPDSDYLSVRVSFTGHGDAAVLSALEFVDGLNQTTVIEFQDAQINPVLDPERFDFVVPAGAHVLGGPD